METATGTSRTPESAGATLRCDLNCDLGEFSGGRPTGDDAAMFQLITSANIACGFHAGVPLTMRESCLRALDSGVAIGAHVSYRDLAGFGRRAMDIAAEDLYRDVLSQLSALAGIAASVGGRLSYVKPHGALYNRIVTDPAQADAVARAVRDFDATLPQLGLSGTQAALAADRYGIRFIREAFVDRAYAPDGSLVPRGLPGAVLSASAADGASEIAARAVAMVADGEVDAIDGTRVRVRVDSLCVHGDTADAVGMARAVRAALRVAGVVVAPFTSATLA
ncbi:MAG: 5-oxoprolinase subunit PxpA [Microbacteriaceae bacterium]